MQQLSAAELSSWLKDEARSAPLMIDVREPWEFQHCSIPGSRLIPMYQIEQAAQDLPRDEPIVVICHHGVRSLQTALFLSHYGFRHIYNLKGGVNAWAEQVDPSMPRY